MRLAGLLSLALLAWACDGGGSAPGAGAQATSTYELRAVVEPALAALKAELEAEQGSAPPVPEDLVPHVEGLLSGLASSRDALRTVMLEELAGLGAPAVPLLKARALDREAPAGERLAAVEALAAIDSPAAAAVLLEPLELSRSVLEPEGWLLAQCAWQLGRTSQDWVVPELLLCLRYEKNHEVVVWMARTLAGFGNFTGLDALFVVARRGSSDEVRTQAAGVLNEIARDTALEDAGQVLAAWNGGRLDELPPERVSARHRYELWRRIQALSEWQLRGVDDGRFLLSRTGPAAAELLARALREENRYIRVHAGQCLERMGPRARVAVPALVEGLEDPALATQAAAALGAIGELSAASALVERLGSGFDYELRVAAARALAGLGRAENLPPLEGLLVESEGLDLQVAAGIAILAIPGLRDFPTGPATERRVLELLIGELDQMRVDPAWIQPALETWIAREHPELSEELEAVATQDPIEKARARAELLRRRLLGAE